MAYVGPKGGKMGRGEAERIEFLKFTEPSRSQGSNMRDGLDGLNGLNPRLILLKHVLSAFKYSLPRC